MTTTTSARETTALELPVVRGPDWRGATFAFLLTVLAAIALAMAFVVGLGQAYEGRVMPGVRVAGIDLAGLDRRAAETRLRESLPSLSAGRLTLQAGEEVRIVPYASLGRDYDMTATLDAAYGVGRAGSLVERTLDELRSLLRGTALQPVSTFDRARLDAHLAAVAASLERAPVDATAALAEDGIWFTTTPGREGRHVEAVAAVDLAAAHLATLDPADLAVDLDLRVLAPAVTTEEAQTAAARAQVMTIHELTLVTGKDEFSIAPAAQKQWVYFGATPSGEYLASLVSGRIQNSLKALAGEVDRAPRNASFRVDGGRVVGVVAGLNGRRLDSTATASRVDDVLTAQGASSPPPRVGMVVASTSPNLTTAEAESFAPRMRNISGWTTPFVPGIKNFFGKNIAIPTSKIDGYVLAPGEWFDFWAAVGEVSRAAGYGDGGAIINGRTEPTGALAGGICSCSTTLFNAAARAGLELGARRNHYYYINRYPKGLDATVFKSSTGSTQTMSFRNDTPYPILIRGINGYGTVTFQIYSVPNGRTTRFSTPIVKNFRPASDSVVYTSALRPGQRERIEYPVDGFDSWVTRTVTDKSGTVIHQETFYSHYARVTGIVRVGR